MTVTFWCEPRKPRRIIRLTGCSCSGRLTFGGTGYRFCQVIGYQIVWLLRAIGHGRLSVTTGSLLLQIICYRKSLHREISAMAESRRLRAINRRAIHSDRVVQSRVGYSSNASWELFISGIMAHFFGSSRPRFQNVESIYFFSPITIDLPNYAIRFKRGHE